MNGGSKESSVELAQDVCALPLACRLAAMLNRDPAGLREGAPLPRGWHVILFNAPTLQSQLRPDGAAGLGVTLPELGLPRLMMGGRQLRFDGDIPLGARVRRETRQGAVQLKQGRSGRFALVKVEHRIFVEDALAAAVIENIDYVLRESSGAGAATAAVPAAFAAGQTAAAQPPIGSPEKTATCTILPDERMLFRYSAITDNPHRIHYDQPYAIGTEGYPALVVNGSLPAMFLLELFRVAAGREPSTLTTRNVAAMYCGNPLQLNVLKQGSSWRLWAQDDQGTTTFEARAE